MFLNRTNSSYLAIRVKKKFQKFSRLTHFFPMSPVNIRTPGVIKKFSNVLMVYKNGDFRNG